MVYIGEERGRELMGEQNEPTVSRSCCTLLRTCVRYLVELLVREMFRLCAAFLAAPVVPSSIIDHDHDDPYSDPMIQLWLVSKNKFRPAS